MYQVSEILISHISLYISKGYVARAIDRQNSYALSYLSEGQNQGQINDDNCQYVLIANMFLLPICSY